MKKIRKRYYSVDNKLVCRKICCLRAFVTVGKFDKTSTMAHWHNHIIYGTKRTPWSLCLGLTVRVTDIPFRICHLLIKQMTDFILRNCFIQKIHFWLWSFQTKSTSIKLGQVLPTSQTGRDGGETLIYVPPLLSLWGMGVWGSRDRILQWQILWLLWEKNYTWWIKLPKEEMLPTTRSRSLWVHHGGKCAM